MHMDYKKLAWEQEDYIVAMRREFHRHPEVSDHEDRTVARIMEELKKMDIDSIEVPHGGVLAFLGNAEKGRTVLLRADIDALPIQESPVNAGGNPKPAVSEVPGVAHTCGHDCHAAMLLGAAKILKSHEDELNGRIVLMFERGEEGTGNLVYLHKWIFEHGIRIDSSFGMHVFPMMPACHITVFPKEAMAGPLSFQVKLIGKTAHGSEPNVGRSPIDCFNAIYNAMQSLRMKYASPFVPMVFSVGQVHAGAANNIIPSELTFGGSFRLYDHEDGLRIKEELQSVIDCCAKMFHCRAEANITGPALGLVNDPLCSEFAREKFAAALGDDTLCSGEPLMGSESHSATAKLWPGTFIALGIANEEKGITARNHHECFDVDESSLKYGTAAHVCYAVEYLEDGPDTSDRVYRGDIREFYRQYSPRSLYAFEEA